MTLDINITQTKGGYEVKVGKAHLLGIFLSPLDAQRAAQKYLGTFAESERQRAKRGRKKKED